jgi:hypothetical protein
MAICLSAGIPVGCSKYSMCKRAWVPLEKVLTPRTYIGYSLSTGELIFIEKRYVSYFAPQI